MKSEIIERIQQEYNRKQRLNKMKVSQAKQALSEENPEYEGISKELARTGGALAMSVLQKNSNSEQLQVELKKKMDALDARANQIFQQYAKDTNMRLMFECPVCRDTGVVDGKMCKCFKDKLVAELKVNCGIRAEELDALGGLQKYSCDIFDDRVDEEKYGIKESPRSLVKEALAGCIRLADAQCSHNMMFTGRSGTGKSFLAKSLACELLERGTEVYFIGSADMFDRLISEKFDRVDSEEGLMKTLKEAEVLIIDDLGVENRSEAKTALLLQILAARLEQPRKSTIITSNIKLEFFDEKYDERVRSRISGAFKLYRFIGEDLRIKLR